MQAIIIIIAVVLLLKFLATSHKAAAIPIETSITPTACGGSGDSFFGNTTVAGVCEPHPSMPPVTVHCCHIVAHFPVDPPPIAIQRPIPVTVTPTPTPTPTPWVAPKPIAPIRPVIEQPSPVSVVPHPTIPVILLPAPTPKPPTPMPVYCQPATGIRFLAGRPMPVSPYRMRVL